MHPQTISNTPQNQSVLDAWHQGIVQAAPNPDLRKRLDDQQGELLPRFAGYYQGLGALPRRARRTLQRQWKKSLAGIALLLALGQTPALAATINVGGDCTLGRAITSANNDASPQGFCTPGSGADRIVLPANSTHTLTTVNNTALYGSSGLPVIRSDITIDGNGSTIRRAPSAPAFRIFTVAGNGDLTLRRTRVSGGRSVGIFNIGSVTLTNSTISGNTGTGVFDSYVCCEDYGELTAINSTISGNSGLGVLDLEAAGVTLLNSTVSGNGRGGVAVSTLTDLTMANSTVSGNKGEGIFNYYSFVTVTNSTISGNADSGVEIANGFATFTNSTISGNRSASDAGGGVRNHLDSQLTLNRTLISGNTAPNGSEVFNDSDSTLNAANFNVLGHRGLTNAQAFVGFTPGATDITATSNGNRPTVLSAILNTTLANNGGPTRTHALVAGSPAVDAVTNVNTCPPPARDQRGVVRPRDGNGDGGVACDTGSFER
jgi:hypothetical protein